MAEPRGTFEHGYTCREVVELAADYVEGAMPPDEATLFEMHLNFCDGCMWFIEQLQTTAELAGRIEPEKLPEDLQEQLLQAFRDWRHP
jgi:Putative zinc-finger